MSLIAVHNHVALFHINIAPSTFIASFTLSLFFFFVYLVISGFVAPLRFPSLNPLSRLFGRKRKVAQEYYAEEPVVALPEIEWRNQKALPALPQQERPVLQLTDYEHNSPLDSPGRNSLRSFFSISRRSSNISNKTLATNGRRDSRKYADSSSIEITELEDDYTNETKVVEDNDGLPPETRRSKPSGRFARRLPRTSDPAADAAALLRPLPVGPLGIRSVVVAGHQRRSSRGRGALKGVHDGRERERSIFSLRRWLQPASLEKTRKR
jgi:hypothetical protein